MKKTSSLIMFVFLALFPALAMAAVLPKTNWRVQYVDSEELIGENGAAKNVFDGDVGTFWHTEWFSVNPSPPHEIQLDLGSTFDLYALRYLPRQDGGVNGTIKGFEIYLSTDGLNWGVPVAAGNFTAGDTEKEITFSNQTARFMRLRALSEVNDNPWTSAAEITLLGDVPTGNTPPFGTINTPTKDLAIAAGETVYFTGEGTDIDGHLPLSYHWNFGNGSGVPDSTQKDPGEIPYAVPGVYPVTLTVSDGLGAVDPNPVMRIVTVRDFPIDLYPYWADISEPPLCTIDPAFTANPVVNASKVTDVQATFTADPFLLQENGTWYLFSEVMNSNPSRGVIGLSTSTDAINWVYEKVVLSESFHLSYPLVFKYQNDYYMLPETSATNSIRLYKATNFPYAWTFLNTLISGREYVDPSLFWFNNVWWLFASDPANANLYLFYSDNLTDGWIEHPQSPVIRNDPKKARPAGRPVVFDQDRIFRFGQKDDISYGEAVGVYEITTLTKEDYQEQAISESPLLVGSGTGWNASGMHNVDPWWDGQQWVCSVDGRNGETWSVGIFVSEDVTKPDGLINSPSGDIAIDVGNAINFSGQGTSPAGNLPLTFLWNFGAGSGIADSTLATPGLKTFNQPGIYPVTLTVTDSLGNIDTTPATLTVTVNSTVTPISNSNWILRFVDSQELIGENGAAANAFDGNPQTFWHTAWSVSNPRPPHEIQIDLGFFYTIQGFRYLPRRDGGFNGNIGSYEFYVSSDGVNWITPVATGTFLNNALEKEVSFAPVTGRFVRLRALSEVNTNPWTAVAEINVLGVLSTMQSPDGQIDSPTEAVTLTPGDGVVFTGTGIPSTGNLPLSYRWNFGVGSGISDSTLEDPGLVYFNLPGTYMVTLTVTDSLGFDDPTPGSLLVTVTNTAPILPQVGWTLSYVDSQELLGENGAGGNAFDGNPLSFWHTEWLMVSPRPPHEIQIDLGSVYSLEGFRYLPRQDGTLNGMIGQYEFYVSSDGIGWGSPVVSGTFQKSASVKDAFFSPISGRYVRLRALSEVNLNPWTTVAELNLFGRFFAGNLPPDGTISGPSGNVVIPIGGTVFFSGTGTDSDGDLPHQYRWDFGKGSGIPDDTVKDPGTIQFNVPGTFAVTLAVTDARGVIDPSPASVIVTVSAAALSGLATNFSLNSQGTGIPANWSERWRMGVTAYTVQKSESAIGNELLYQTDAFSGDIGGGRRLITFNADDTLSADVETLTLFEPYFGGTTHSDVRLYLRASGTSPGAESAYFLTTGDSLTVGNVVLYKYVNGVLTPDLARLSSYPFRQNQRYWARVRALGSQLSAKIWPFGGIESAEWDLSVTDTSLPAPGWVGVGVFPENDYSKFYQFAVAENGATAKPLDYGLSEVRLNLPNLDAESGSVDDWTNEYGTILIDANFQRGGSNCFAGGAANWRAYQRIDLSSAGVTQLLGVKPAYLSFAAWQRAYQDNNDPGRIGIRFLDSTGAEISSVFSAFDGVSTSYVKKHLAELIPVAARYADILLEGQYVSGNVTGAYFDDLEVGYTYGK